MMKIMENGQKECFFLILGFITCFVIFDVQYRCTVTFSTERTPERPSEKCIIENVSEGITEENRKSQNRFILTIQKERQATLQRACQRIYDNPCKETTGGLRTRSFCSRKYNISSCVISKAGFSSWVGALLIMEDIFSVQEHDAIVDDVGSVLKLAYRMLAPAKKADKKDITKHHLQVITVRNPFARLVSAYRSKMQGTNVKYNRFYHPLSKKIKRKYSGLREKPQRNRNLSKGRASFEDFVNFLVHETPRDNHWIQYEKACDPCNLNYDYIAKLETMEQDMDYLRERLQISNYHKPAFFPPQQYKTTDEVVQKAFSSVPKELANKLYEIYQNDFEMFGYERPSWLC